MLDIKELLNSHSNSFQLIEVLEYTASNKIVLNVESVEAFMSFANDLNANHIFFRYLYYSSDDFLLFPEDYSEDKDEIKEEVEKHNRLISSLDFSRPYQLDLFILLSGTVMIVSLLDYWIDELEILDRDNKAEKLEMYYLDYFESKKEQYAKKAEEDKKVLREYILSDPEFSYKKNQRLRQEYLIKLLEKNRFQNYEYLFDGKYDRGISIPMKDFMDRTWREYMDNKKN